MEKKDLIGGKTRQEIDVLKSKHGAIKLVSTTDADGNDAHFFFKRPDRATLSATMKIIQDDPLEGVAVFAKNCLVDGDDTKIDDPITLLTISDPIQEFLKTRAVEVKNL